MPHGFCFQWQPIILWLTVLSDLLIFLAYLSIPIALGYFVYKRKDLQNRWLFILFSAFIFSCGMTHLLGAVNIWFPLYGLAALTKLITALISLVTAILLWPLIPVALRIPSPLQLQIVNRQLKNLNSSLDQQVYERTRELEKHQTYLQHTIALCPSVIYILKPTGIPSSPFAVSFISEKITEISGFTPDEWYQNETLWIDHIHPDYSSNALKNMSLLLEQGCLTHEYPFQKKRVNIAGSEMN